MRLRGGESKRGYWRMHIFPSVYQGVLIRVSYGGIVNWFFSGIGEGGFFFSEGGKGFLEGRVSSFKGKISSTVFFSFSFLFFLFLFLKSYIYTETLPLYIPLPPSHPIPKSPLHHLKIPPPQSHLNPPAPPDINPHLHTSTPSPSP